MKWHPEQKKNEFYYGTMSKYDFIVLDWKNKRKGIVPYDIYGNKLENYKKDYKDYVPVFIKIDKELINWLKKHNYNLDNSPLVAPGS